MPLLDLSPQVGFTKFCPQSHHYKNFVGFGPVVTLVEATYDGLVYAGDAVWYDYRWLHRGMPNDTEEGVLRCIIQMIVKRKTIRILSILGLSLCLKNEVSYLGKQGYFHTC